MKIVICGSYGAKNLGDEMILKGLLESLKNAVPKAEITVLSGDPKETRHHHGVRSFEKFPAGMASFIRGLFGSTKSTKKAVKNCDYFILGGGGLFGSFNFRAYIIWGIQALKAYAYKRPVIMYGQSIGHLRGPFRRFLVKALFKRARLIAVRDTESKLRLENLKIAKKIYVIPDLALSTACPKPLKKDKKEIIVALRQMDDLSLLFKKNIAVFLDWLIDKRAFYVKFIDFQAGDKDDTLLHNEITSILNTPSHASHLREVQNPGKVLEEFCRADFVLGMRLHSIISAFKTAIPFIAINYAPKVGAFLKDAGFTENMLGINLDSDDLINLFKQTEHRKDSIKHRMQEFAAESLKAHREMEKVLKTILV